MGDTLLATPVIRAFKRTYPSVYVDALAERIPAQILRNNPDISEVIVAPSRGANLRDYHPLIHLLREKRYALAIDALSTPGSALLCWLTGARRRIGYDLPYRPIFYTDPVPPPTGVVYSAIAKRILLDPLAIDFSGEQVREALPAVYPGEAELELARALPGGELDPDRVVLGLAPFCKREWKQWDLKYWVEALKLLDVIARPQWLLFAGQGEREQLAELEHSGLDVRWIGADDLLHAAAVMRRGAALIGGDNGLLHVAVGASVPTLTIFAGRDDPARWVPPGRPDHLFIDLRGVREDPDQVEGVSKMIVAFLNSLSLRNS